MADEMFSNKDNANTTKRYNEVLTQEVSESWIIDVLEEQDFYDTARPPTAPKLPPLARLKIR